MCNGDSRSASGSCPRARNGLDGLLRKGADGEAGADQQGSGHTKGTGGCGGTAPEATFEYDANKVERSQNAPAALLEAVEVMQRPAGEGPRLACPVGSEPALACLANDLGDDEDHGGAEDGGEQGDERVEVYTIWPPVAHGG